MKKLTLTLSLILLTATSAFSERAEITINGLVCDFCARAMEKTFSKKEEVKNIDVNLDNGIITVFFNDDKTLSDETLKEAVLDAGYDLKEIKRREYLIKQ